MAIHRLHIIVRKQTVLGFCSIGLSALIALIGFGVMPTTFSMAEGWNFILLNWLGVLLLVWSLVTWYAVRREILSPYTVFLCCSYLFMYGQGFLWAFGLRGIPDLRDSFPVYQIALAQIFTLLSLGFFHAGALYSANRRSNTVDLVERSDSKSQTLYRCIQIVGWGLFVISVIPFTSLTIGQVMTTFSYGYGALYDAGLARSGFAAIGISIAQFFVPSLICLFIGYRTNPLILLSLSALIAIRVAIAFYVGGRSPAAVLVVCTICMWHYFIGRVTLRKGLLLVLLGYLFVSVLPAVGSIRSMAGRGLHDYVLAFSQSVGKNEQFIKAISEMGGSMFPLIQTMNLVPSQYSFRYGGSYLYSLFSLIPNLGFWKVHPAFQNANLGDWLQEVLGLGYGPGFSPTAEAYINFGWGGILAMFVLGLFYGRVFTLIDRDSASRRPDLASFTFILLSLVIMTTRNSFIATVRAVFYYAAPVYVVTLLLSSYAARKRVSNLSKYIDQPETKL